MTVELETKEFFRKPFVVEAVQITTDNIVELAPLIGQLREKENGTPYILVNRDLIKNVVKVFPGYWYAIMGENTRCYSERVFAEQFIEVNPSLEIMITQINEEIVGDGGSSEVPDQEPEDVVE